ncbi:MAG TPA: hypothetical protein VFV43_09115 [Limnobacter sp.]|nr:hypothetical protein [Limnobacter sp.]
MTIPVFTALPDSPSRVGDPNNFGLESIAFLNAQPGFVTEANNVRAYLNALNVDPFNWGLVNVTAPTRETVAPLPVAPVVGELDLVFTSKADALLAGLEFFADTDANPAGVYIDALAVLSDAPGFVVDDLRPTVPMVQPSPLATDSQATFETKAFAFYSSLPPYVASFAAFADWIYGRLVEPEDFGLVADAVTETDDFGELA